MLSAENIKRTNANHDKNVLKSMVNLNQNDNSPNSLGYLQPPKDKIEVKKEEDIDERNKEDNECFLGCLNCTMKCCECTIV